MKNFRRGQVLTFGFGLLIGGLLTFQVQQHGISHSPINKSGHKITEHDNEYHVHADFLIYLNDQKLDLAQDEFMTTGEKELHESVHLHDSNGSVVHLHEENITFSEFLESIGVYLTDECIMTEEDSFCSDDDAQIELYVNDERFPQDITNYVPQDDDAILVYFGAPDQEKITRYLNEVKDDACYYSGTCPERGVAPSESCGLTCEL